MRLENGLAIFDGDPVLEVKLRRSRKARRLNLRVSGLDGRATLSMPASLPLAQAVDFLQQKESWLRAASQRVPGLRPVVPGADILLRGQQLRIIEDPDALRIVTTADALRVPRGSSRRSTAQRLADYLKAQAQADLHAASLHFAGLLGRRFSALHLRDTRSRWGSCTAQGRLMYSWRLIMAPPPVLRYVAAHEVAHLAHMDHSPAFWGCVKALMPDYPPHRTWLRRHGADLHSYCFKARPTADSE